MIYHEIKQIRPSSHPHIQVAFVDAEERAPPPLAEDGDPAKLMRC